MIKPTSSFTGNEPLLDFKFQVPQEISKDEEVHSVEELKNLCRNVTFLCNSNSLYRNELSELADSILKKVTMMQLSGSQSAKILAYSKKSIKKLQTAKDNFYNSKCSFKNESSNFINQCTSLEERINNSSNCYFNTLTKQVPRLPTPEELMRETPCLPKQPHSILEKEPSTDMFVKTFSKLQTAKADFDNSKLKSLNLINQYNLLEEKLNKNSLVSSDMMLKSSSCAIESKKNKCEETISQVIKEIQQCPRAKKLWDDVSSDGKFSVVVVSQYEAPNGAQVDLESRVIVISSDETEINRIREHLTFELNNLKRAKAFTDIQSYCCRYTNEIAYAKEIERVEYSSRQETVKVLNACKEDGIWPDVTPCWEHTSFDDYYEYLQSIGHSGYYSSDWLKNCKILPQFQI